MTTGMGRGQKTLRGLFTSWFGLLLLVVNGFFAAVVVLQLRHILGHSGISADLFEVLGFDAALWTGLGFLLAFAFGIVGASLLMGELTRPLAPLTTFVASVAEGKEGKTLPVIRSDEVGVITRHFNEIAQSLQTARGFQSEKDLMKKELDIANHIQALMLPKEPPHIPGFSLNLMYRPAKEASGDYYDFIKVDDKRFGVAVADVSGKGMGPAMIMTVTRSYWRALAIGQRSPAEVLKRVNRAVHHDIRDDMFVTMLYAIFNVEDHQIKVASAGHDPLLICHKNGTIESIKPEGPPLGVDDGMLFDEAVFDLDLMINPGDIVALYTDGVTEAMNAKEEVFGYDRLKEVVRANVEKPAVRVLQAVGEALEQFTQGHVQSDDITIVTVKLEQSKT